MSPAKMVIADMVMIAAIAGTGSRKKVNGTSSAAARVAVMPGSDPITRPNSAARTTTRTVVGSATSWKAPSKFSITSEPPDEPVGKLDHQALLEHRPQAERGQHSGQHRRPPSGAQRPHDGGDDDGHGHREPEDRGAQDVEHDRAQDRKSTRLNSSHVAISYAVFCLKKKNEKRNSSLQKP